MMMRRAVWAMSSALALMACGGSDGGSSTVAVVSGPATSTPATTPTPTPTPTPTATPTPTPSSYVRYADLTGDQNFQTACASLVGSSGLPSPQPALPYGEAVTLGFTAASGGRTISGDGVSLMFATTDKVAAATGQTSYQKTVSGSVQSFTIIDPVVAGSTLSYTRSFSLRADRSAGSTLFSCVFGVPSLLADLPAASVSYGKVVVTGTAYLPDQNGVVQIYVLSNSTATVAFDQASNAMVVSIHLIGNLQSAGVVAATTTDLGTYTGSGSVDSAHVRFGGQLDSANRVNLFSSFSGAFFGAVESGFAFEVLAADTGAGTRVAAVGTVIAAR